MRSSASSGSTSSGTVPSSEVTSMPSLTISVARWRGRHNIERYSGFWVDWVDPVDLFGRLDWRDVGDIDHDRLVVRAHQHALQRLGRVGVDLLVRHEWRRIDEIARIGRGDVFEALAPAHAGVAGHDIDHAFELAVMVDAGLGVGGDRHGAGPDLLRADARLVDCGLAEHAGRLRGVRIELVAFDDAHAVVLPAWIVIVVVGVAVVAAHQLTALIASAIVVLPEVSCSALPSVLGALS